jgi:hypothetical protein
VVHIRIGEGWKEDPRVRSALRSAGDASARGEAVREIVDAVAIEVDGVDIAAGRAEGPVLGAAEALVRAVARLVAGGSQASVPFQDGAVELVIRRRGGSALLSIVTLSRPARVLARDVEVDLEGLAGAAREAADGLCHDLAEVEPLSAAAPSLRRLLREASRLHVDPAPAPGPALPTRARPHRPRRRRGAPVCAFELRDEDGLVPAYRGPGPDLGSLLAPGRVTLRGADGAEVFSAAGVPFLLFRDLSAAAGRLCAAVQAGEAILAAPLALSGRRATLRLEADLRLGTLSVNGGDSVPCPPLLLAQAFLEAALDFCGVVVARNARQAGNGYVAELRAEASDRLAHLRELLAGDLVGTPGRRVRPRPAPRAPRAPLGPGRVRRVAFRRALEAEVGVPAGAGLFRAGGLAVACGASASLGIGPGAPAPRWRGPGAAWAALAGCDLLLAAGSRLSCLDAATGRRRWVRPLTELRGAAPRFAVSLSGGRAVLGLGGSALALDLATGRPVWRFDPPAAEASLAAGYGPLLVLAADTAVAYGLDADGRVAWRHRLPGPAVAPPVPSGDGCLLLCRTDLGGSLVALDPATGHRRWEAPLDFAPAGPPVPFAGLVAVAGTVAGDSVVAAVGPAGAPAWTAAPSLGAGLLALAPLSGGIAVKSAGGACAPLDRSGKPIWLLAREAANPPPGNLPPVAVRGVLLVPSEHVDALDEATGAPLGAAAAVAPASLLVDSDLSLHALDSEGLLTVLRLATHLSVVV